MAEVRQNEGAHRFEIWVADDLAGFADYRDRDGVRSFLHTEIEPAFEGHGAGSTLIKAALDQTRAAGFGVLPFCPFVRAFIGKHPDYADLIPADQRQRFELVDADER
ncbi:MAG: N-acetyltransferase [Frankiales bacterium]|nr:N-acetyltransferase [Frankiales bacterium]